MIDSSELHTRLRWVLARCNTSILKTIGGSLCPNSYQCHVFATAIKQVNKSQPWAGILWQMRSPYSFTFCEKSDVSKQFCLSIAYFCLCILHMGIYCAVQHFVLFHMRQHYHLQKMYQTNFFALLSLFCCKYYLSILFLFLFAFLHIITRFKLLLQAFRAHEKCPKIIWRTRTFHCLCPGHFLDMSKEKTFCSMSLFWNKNRTGHFQLKY